MTRRLWAWLSPYCEGNEWCNAGMSSKGNIHLSNNQERKKTGSSLEVVWGKNRSGLERHASNTKIMVEKKPKKKSVEARMWILDFHGQGVERDSTTISRTQKKQQEW